MHAGYTPPCLTLLAAGLAARGALAQDALPRFARGVPVAQIHYDLRTGNHASLPFGSGSRDASDPVWLNNNADPCATGGTVGVIDDPDTDLDGFGDLFGGACVGGTFPCEGTWNNWWGDLHGSDTVIERIVLRYATTAPDVDLDSDAIGDGVPGFDLYLNFADNDNGFGFDGPGASGRSCIIELCLEDLPGMVEGSLPPGFAAIYEIVVDLAQSAPSLVFELGDSDAIDDAGTGLSGAAIYGHPTFRDLDSDGGHDFSWAIRFDQSTIPQPERGVTGFITVAPKLNNPGDLPPHPADAQGIFDAVDIYSSGPSCPPDVTPGIFLFFGHFTCAPGAETPPSSSFIELYGEDRAPCSRADSQLPYETLDFADVTHFLGSVASGSGFASNFAPPYFVFDFADVLEFLTQFSAGCP